MSARELAAELSQLKPKDRERLLAELPPARREQIQGLLQDLETMLHGRSRTFEQHLQEEATVPQPHYATLNDGQLRVLLGAEHPRIQQHLITTVKGGQLSGLAPCVRSLVEEYLAQRRNATPLHVPSKRRRDSRWWQIFFRRES